MDKKPFIVMYHGAVNSGRGIEQLIQVVATNPNLYGVILGNGSDSYISRLHDMADELGVSKRILFHEAVPQYELWKYIGAADLELILIQNVSRSYYLSLPNKFFESVQSLTPMITSDFPEMSRLINEYSIGLTCIPDMADSIAECVEQIRCNEDQYADYKNNLKVAKNDLSWENESRVLYNAYGELLHWSNDVAAVKMLLSNYSLASRDQREVSVMKELGWNVRLAYPLSLYGCEKTENCIDIKRYKITANQNPLWRKFLVIANELCTIFQVRKIKADIISCHDLKALRYAWIAFLGKKRPILVYDSHEFELGRYTERRRGRISTKMISIVERFLMKRIPMSIMVNESIATEVMRIHKLQEKPVVVRNVPIYYEINGDEVMQLRKQYLEYFNNRR